VAKKSGDEQKPPQPKPAPKPAKPRPKESNTVKQAKKLALAVIREHGLPDEIIAELAEAGVRREILERFHPGGHGDDYFAPHGAWWNKKK
jgi:ribonuclease D